MGLKVGLIMSQILTVLSKDPVAITFSERFKARVLILL